MASRMTHSASSPWSSTSYSRPTAPISWTTSRQRSGAYIIFYQGGTIDHGTHVSGPVAQSNAESEYNAACTAEMDLAHFIMFVHELLNDDPEMVPKEAPLIVLDSKSAMCMAKNGKDTKHNRHIARRMHSLQNAFFLQYVWYVWYPYHS